MVNFLCKAFLHGRRTITSSSTHELLSPRNPSSLMSLKFISSTANDNSLTVSYLINSCGLSPEAALTVSKNVRFKTLEKPESVLAFLHNHGFSKTQISEVVKKYPEVLGSDPEKTLLPKFEFFKSKGVLRPELVKVLCSHPSILHRSLENQLIPSFEILNDVFKSDEKTFLTIKRYSRLLLHDLKTCVSPNIHTLRDNGVPEPNIAAILCHSARMFFTYPDKFRESVEEVKEKGFNPSMFTFVTAVRALRAMSKLTWKKKIDVYKRWGWSEEVILMAFRRFPIVMTLSEDKIMGMMDYYVNVLGLESSFISERPELLGYSLKKRVVPRGSVARVLMSKGLVKASSLTRLFLSREKLFLERFVYRYQEEAPQLLKLYTETLDFSRQLKKE
ncbi:hypothetical protein HS088_TW14G01117 [Tripterygium wilfordii]|uniref:Mitochondrial transcription termination factor family protein n=1 Tax=Tripterygium wilfordii TaxID=458696 RepID=A0A7J7CS69_TRIWF|nr:uncharacterized protein LOC120014521 [Tripterygium wilfordii]KAF5736962.1 hypothetical protein HS088_TW14G01117 [Tripterygium wilfordii]